MLSARSLAWLSSQPAACIGCGHHACPILKQMWLHRQQRCCLSSYHTAVGFFDSRACIVSVFFFFFFLRQVYGALSLIVWSLTIVVSVKYVVCILSADANGEGGTFALLSLLRSVAARIPARLLRVFFLTAAFGASLLIGDGVITPAISGEEPTS